MKKGRQIRYLVIAVLVVFVALFVYRQMKNDDAVNGGTSIETSILETGDIVQTVATSGSVRPLITVEVGSQLSGQVAEIFADFNSQVSKGQIIALIDPKTFESRVLQNRADLSVAMATITVQQANIDRAKANLRKARLEYERAEPLAKAGTLSESEYETALATYESAKADLTVAEAQLENAKANKQQRQASLESVEIDLERTRIRSPIDGVVIERSVDKGQTVAASLSSPVLYKIAQDLTEIQIEANVDEADIGNVKQGNKATFEVDAYPDTEFSGTVSQVRLAPIELNNVVTYTVIITAGNPQRKLLPGMTAIVEIVTGKSENVLRVANSAVRFKPATGSALAGLAPESSNHAGERRSDSNDGQRGRGGGQGNIGQLREQLGLNEQQAGLIEAEMKQVFSQMRSQSQAGGNPADRESSRRQRRQLISAVLEEHLSAEQFSQYQEIQRQAGQSRPGLLWIMSDDGEIKPVSVRLGINDDNYTQIISRQLKQGEEAVTRIRYSDK